jgi:hypothetical protein
MPDKEFELDDPFQPVAVSFPTPGYDGTAVMARCFVEEYALMGWPPEKVYRLFTIPEFAASYAVLQERGPAFVKEVIASVFGEEPPDVEADDGLRLVPVLKRGSGAGEGESDATGL